MFFTKEEHPLSVMVWGGIGRVGFRTKLLRVESNMDSRRYCNMLISKGIVANLLIHHGNNFIFQQDNAPPHSSKYTKEHLLNQMPSVLKWHAKSPDLNRIEQIWDYLKERIKGVKFTSADQLFQRLAMEWANIPNEVIHNCYSAFKVRCIVCDRLNGENLNGHWKNIKKEHDLYRTRIVYFNDIFGNQIISQQ